MLKPKINEVELCIHCNPVGKWFSFSEKELCKYIKSIYDNVIIENSRNIISPLELDIFLPDIKLAIEFNGMYWHSLRPDGYHDKKIELCNKKGIKLIYVWEDEWKSKNDEVKKEIY